MDDSVEYRNWLVSQGSELDFECLELWMFYRSLTSREEEEFQDMAYTVADAVKVKDDKE